MTIKEKLLLMKEIKATNDRRWAEHAVSAKQAKPA